MQIDNNAYQLIDGGAGQKLEKFGEYILIRPSSVSFWKQRGAKQWKQSAAIFDPDRGWIKNKCQDEWQVDFSDFKLLLRLQQNGQLGFFPEHASYMPRLNSVLATKNKPKVLNIFAYTGMASVVSALAGAHVTHVDVSKKCLTWASSNFKLNNIPESQLRLIPEDALQFLRREKTRGNKYDLVIADPPSFYRVDRNKVWKLDENFHELMSLCIDVLAPEASLFITCHSFSLEIFRNLILDFESSNLKINNSYDLLIEDSFSRKMPAGVFAECELSSK